KNPTFKVLSILFVFRSALALVIVLPIVRLSPALVVQGQTQVRNFRGNVVDYQTNTPIPKATVNVVDSSNIVLVSDKTDESGVFYLGSLSPGRYLIRVIAAGYDTYLQAYLLPRPRIDTVLEIPTIALTKRAANDVRRYSILPSYPPGRTSALINPRMPNPNLVEVRFTVTDRYGRFVSGLNKNVFTLIEGGSLKTIDYFSDDAEPFTVGLVFALSDAASIDMVNAAQVAVSNFVDLMGRDFHDFIVVRYNSRTDAILKNTVPAGRQAASRSVVFLETKSKMGVFEACSLALVSIEKRSATTGKVLVLVTDMLDNNSLGNPDDLYRRLRQSDVKFFAVGISGKKHLVSAAKDDNSPVVSFDELASVSGGQASFFSGGEELNDYFEKVALWLEHMYTIGFRPSSPEREDNLYRIYIKINPPRGLPRLTVGSDEGFFWGHKPLIVVDR
ncbi:MAG: carboxypeptidase regulatory-like domain-containing protein, partial [Pyrinomonadaceae bacterium]